MGKGKSTEKTAAAWGRAGDRATRDERAIRAAVPARKSGGRAPRTPARRALAVLLAVLLVPAIAAAQPRDRHRGKVIIESTATDAVVSNGGVRAAGGMSIGAEAAPAGGLVVDTGAIPAEGAAVAVPGGLIINAAQASPDWASFLWGDGSGWRLNFGTRSGGNFASRFQLYDSGSARFATGAANAPSMSFISYPTTGLYASGFGNLRIAVGGVDGLEVQAGGQANIPSRDAGTIGGASFLLGRNTNATTPASGTLGITNRAGTFYYLWVDASAQLRIHTDVPSSFSGVSDTGGTVVGTQTSARATKNVAGEVNDTAAAMAIIRATPVWQFTYKNGAYNGETFYGITTDDSPIFGMDGGKSFNPVTAFGATVLALRDLDARLAALERENARLRGELARAKR